MSNSKFETDTADIAAELAALRDDIAKLGATVTDLVRHQAEATGVGVHHAFDSARDSLASSAGDAQAHIRKTSAEFESAIERNPLTAVLVALGIGLFLGMASRDRR